jgi:hypothetical protein
MDGGLALILLLRRLPHRCDRVHALAWAKEGGTELGFASSRLLGIRGLQHIVLIACTADEALLTSCAI